MIGKENRTFFFWRNLSVFSRIIQLVGGMAGTRSAKFSGSKCHEPLRIAEIGRLGKDLPEKRKLGRFSKGELCRVTGLCCCLDRKTRVRERTKSSYFASPPIRVARLWWYPRSNTGNLMAEGNSQWQGRHSKPQLLFLPRVRGICAAHGRSL